MKKLVIIGGGASGLMAAVAAGREGAEDITVIERNERMGRKLMITGKGRCNVTNNCDNETLIKNTVRNGRFLYSAFDTFGSRDTVDFFTELNVPLKTERGNRVFPVSDKAVSIVDALVKETARYSVSVHDRAKALKISGGKVTAVVCESGRIIEADAVIIATGGMSYPLTGSTGDGYRMAKEAGHGIAELGPSLTDIFCHEGFCSALAGLSLKNVTLALYEKGRKKPLYKELGEMVFTHKGVSGPLVLSASAYIGNTAKEYTLSLDLKPALDENTLDRRILRDFSEKINCDFINSLSELLPKSIIPVAVRLSGIDARKKVNQISSEERARLVGVIKNFPLTVTGLGPIEEAVITRGGVEVREINPSTMESKIVKGLYFSGEIINVDAFTGGFNLQIAFSTGYTAGVSAAKQIKGEII